MPSADAISADVLSALKTADGADVDDEEDAVVDATVVPLVVLDAAVVLEGVGVGVGTGALGAAAVFEGTGGGGEAGVDGTGAVEAVELVEVEVDDDEVELADVVELELVDVLALVDDEVLAGAVVVAGGVAAGALVVGATGAVGAVVLELVAVEPDVEAPAIDFSVSVPAPPWKTTGMVDWCDTA